MRIAIDARKLHDFGIGTYLRNVLKSLARLDTNTEYLLFLRPHDVGFIEQLGENFRPLIEPAAPYSLAEQVSLPLRLLKERVDLFHTPHYVLPPLVPCRSIVTIHDCIHLMFPQYLPNRLAHIYARTFMSVAARRSHRILTVSEASKRDIQRFFPVPDDKITVISNAIDDRFSRPPPSEDVIRVQERFQLDEEFILYAGNIKPHKNLERLIEALHQLRRDGFDRLTLLIIGDEITKYAALRRAVHRYKLHKQVRFLGFVSDSTLAVLYRMASVFVFPSLYEGFGLPPLEAMASGTPVVTSKVSSLPEVVGDAAVLIDPYDACSIADGIRRVLTDRVLEETLRQRGPARAREFSWERSVRQMRDIYFEVAGKVEAVRSMPA